MNILRQADKAWHSVKLGTGSSSIGRAGCLLTCLAQASCNVGKQLTPPELNTLGLAASAFRGSNAIVRALAACAGFDADPARRVNAVQGVKAMRDALDAALATGQALVGVTHDDDPATDHWILASKRNAFGFECSDPATGQWVMLGANLECETVWAGARKHYRSTSVVPLVLRTG